MNQHDMPTSSDQLSRLQIPSEKKSRRRAGPIAAVAIVGAVLIGGGVVFSLTRKTDTNPIPSKATTLDAHAAAATTPSKPGDAVLTVSGYVIPRARIEISPRFQGTVRWIGVKKGDQVKKDQVMVQLDEEEYRARLLESQGRFALAQANLTNADLNLKRQIDLAKSSVESQRVLEDAQRARDAAVAEVTIAKGQVELAQTYLNWCTIRAPINGTILEKLVDPDELVVPQSFGGTRGPSTALVSLADLNDLQIEIDLNEADLSKVHLNQRCQVSPEAYPDKKYQGHVAEIAPEANRSKGTLQVKVQVDQPDQFLTPELTAKVDFLAD
jgi:HlyD family secretion protein